jgi:hypothetical protein
MEERVEDSLYLRRVGHQLQQSGDNNLGIRVHRGIVLVEQFECRLKRTKPKKPLR